MNVELVFMTKGASTYFMSLDKVEGGDKDG